MQSAALADLDRWSAERLATVPSGSRVLVTAHDAFEYFGRRYGFEVVGIQGIVDVQPEGRLGLVEQVRLAGGAGPGLRCELQHLQPHALMQRQDLVASHERRPPAGQQGPCQVKEKALPQLSLGLRQGQRGLHSGAGWQLLATVVRCPVVAADLQGSYADGGAGLPRLQGRWGSMNDPVLGESCPVGACLFLNVGYALLLNAAVANGEGVGDHVVDAVLRITTSVYGGASRGGGGGAPGAAWGQCARV